MRREKELAMQVMESAKKITGWNFQMEQDGGTYYVLTTVTDLTRNNRMAVYYTVNEKYALLTAFSPCRKYDKKYVFKMSAELLNKNAIFHNYGVFATTCREEGFYLNIPLPLDVLEKEMHSITGAVMVELLDTVTEVINHSNRKQ